MEVLATISFLISLIIIMSVMVVYIVLVGVTNKNKTSDMFAIYGALYLLGLVLVILIGMTLYTILTITGNI